MTVAAAEPGAPSLPAAGASGRARGPAYTAVTAVLAGVVYVVVSPTITDDAYITLAYARNFGLHLHSSGACGASPGPRGCRPGLGC